MNIEKLIEVKEVKYIAVDSGKSNTKYTWFDKNELNKKSIQVMPQQLTEEVDVNADTKIN